MSNVPKLRFSEFHGEWEEKKLKEISSLLKDGSHGTHKEFSDSQYLLLSAKNVKNGKINTYSNDRRISKEDYAKIYKNYELKNGDIVLTIVGTIGRTAIVDDLKNIAFQRSVAFFRFDDYCSNYMFHVFNTKMFQNELDRRKVISAQPGIYLGDLGKIRFTLPQKQEQEKIASFLTSVDTKIEQLSKKESFLQEYKKGVMQKIFNQEIRFKDDDGSEFCEWEETIIGKNISNIGGTPLEKFVSKYSAYKFISIGNYSVNGKYIDNGQRIELNEKTKTKLLNQNDLVMVLNDKTSSGDIIGSSILIDEDNKYIYNQRSERITCKDNVLPLYLWHYFNSKQFRKKVFSLAQGGTQIYINFSSIKSILIKLPSIEEQNKIANFLSSIDIKIEQAQKQLEKTKEFKKALLQHMFI